MSVFPVEKVNECIASCDERIASVQSKLDNWKPYASVMGLMAKLIREEDVKVFTEAPQMDNVKTYENNIKLIKVEKMMWNAFKNNSKKDIFKHILSKYDELMCLSYDICSNMVMNGIQAEGDYLDYCKSSLDQREFIRKMCSFGYRGHLE